MNCFLLTNLEKKEAPSVSEESFYMLSFLLSELNREAKNGIESHSTL